MPLSTFASKRKAYAPFTFAEIYKIAQATNHEPSDFIPPQFTASALTGKEVA